MKKQVSTFSTLSTLQTPLTLLTYSAMWGGSKAGLPRIAGLLFCNKIQNWLLSWGTDLHQPPLPSDFRDPSVVLEPNRFTLPKCDSICKALICLVSPVWTSALSCNKWPIGVTA